MHSEKSDTFYRLIPNFFPGQIIYRQDRGQICDKNKNRWEKPSSCYFSSAKTYAHIQTHTTYTQIEYRQRKTRPAEYTQRIPVNV